jgi:hypothetical protein
MAATILGEVVLRVKEARIKMQTDSMLNDSLFYLL